jgi:hypothetical protein
VLCFMGFKVVMAVMLWLDMMIDDDCDYDYDV